MNVTTSEDVKLPPYTVKQVLTANQMADRIGWGEKATNVESAWKVNQGKAQDGRRVRIAVLDTGVDSEHYRNGDLQNVVEMEDFTGHRSPFDAASDGHGTHSLGIVGAEADDRGVVGFCPFSQLLSGRCLSNGSGSSDSVARSIDWARDNGADVISMSLGGPQPSEAIASAIGRAIQAGRFVVCAAGNTGRRDDVNYPARWTGPHGRPEWDTIAVAATGPDGKLAPYSSRGPEVDIAAPGTDIISTYLNGGYASLSGTSMATPAVAGLVGLLVVQHWDLGDQAATPLVTMADLRDHLKRGATDLGPEGRDPGSGWGLINAETVLDPQEPDRPTPGPGEFIDLGIVKIYLPAREGNKIGISW